MWAGGRNPEFRHGFSTAIASSDMGREYAMMLTRIICRAEDFAR